MMMNSMLKKLVPASRVALALVVVAGLAAAQLSAEEAHAKTKSLLELFQTTGIVGYMMLAVSAAGLALVIEHSVNLRRDKLAPPVLADELTSLIDEEKYEEAIELADSEKGYLSTLIGAALRMRHAGYEEMIVGLEQAGA